MSTMKEFSIDLSRLFGEKREEIKEAVNGIGDSFLCEHDNTAYISGQNPQETINLLWESGFDVSLMGLGSCFVCRKKKIGRPAQDKVIRHFSIDSSLARYIDSLPDGQRSAFVNKVLTEYLCQKGYI